MVEPITAKISGNEINSRKTINAWCSYDIANSAYSLSIATVLYPIYYDAVTKEAFGSAIVTFLGQSIKNTVLYEYAISLGYLIVIFLTISLSGLADLGGFRKRFMQIFTIIGALSCGGLYFFNGANIGLGISLPMLAIVGFAGSLVYYNSFLPLIATPDRQDKISARGFSFGYAGSMILLIFNLFSIENYQLFGFEGKLEAIRYAFIEVGVWWLIMAIPAFVILKEKRQKLSFSAQLFTKGFHEIAMVFNYIRHRKTMSRFLLAFFFFSMGVQTIIIIASLFGSAELGITGSKLIITILIIQVLAIAGATLFGYVSSKLGNRTSIIWMLSIWIFICLMAYFIQTELQFYVLGGLVGLVMGGIQSQARSTWSKLLPEESTDTASFFSFYDSTEKLAIVLGMFGFGLVEQITGSMRSSALLLSIFFIASLVIMVLTPLRKNT